jgi:enoyl-CoA hydratase/carnithine racemase
MNDRVILDVSDHVAQVTLNRAAKKNAVDLHMFEALIETAESIAANPAVRVVVMHGAGENFCAGIDISVFQGEGIGAFAGDPMQPLNGSPANFFQSAAYLWRALPVPVIAAIEGYAFGAGMQIALGADIRYASADAKLSIMEIQWGLIPDMAISTTARDVVPLDRLKELAYTGRIVSGDEAQALGLVTAVDASPLTRAQAVATEIAAKSPHAIRAMKKLFDEAWHSDSDAALRCEAQLQTQLMGSPNQMEAVIANLHKRSPAFDDPKQ